MLDRNNSTSSKATQPLLLRRLLHRPMPKLIGLLFFAGVMVAADVNLTKFDGNHVKSVFAELSLFNKAHAEDPAEISWNVVVSVGTVRYRPLASDRDSSWRTISAGDKLTAGSQIETEADSHALLTNGRDTIRVQQESRISLPKSTEAGVTKIQQDLGEALYHVESRRQENETDPFNDDPLGSGFNPFAQQQERFEVHTPFLVAVVKGTSFSIVVGGQHTDVIVTEGTVGVRDVSTGKSSDVSAGQSANTNTDKGLRVSGKAARKGSGSGGGSKSGGGGGGGSSNGSGSGGGSKSGGGGGGGSSKGGGGGGGGPGGGGGSGGRK